MFCSAIGSRRRHTTGARAAVSSALKIGLVSVLLIGAIHSVVSAGQLVTSFPMHRGINVAGPFGRIKPVTSDPDGQLSDFWTLQMYSGWYTGQELRQAGYDFIRLPVNPLPLLENPVRVRGRLLDEVEEGIHTYLSAGMRVVVDLSFFVGKGNWTASAVVSPGNSDVFEAYRAVIEETSRRLAHYEPGQVALELLNEPPGADCETGWIPKQKLLLAEVRKRAPVLPVVVTGCGGQLDGLLALDRSKIDLDDPNLVFTFHFYEPFSFTHQGGHPGLLYIENMLYPASADNLASALDTARGNIDKAGLSAADAVAAKAKVTKDIAQYFAQAPDRRLIDRRFDQVKVWAKANGVPPARILLGEFAAINWRKTDTPEYLHARQLWDKDVQSAAEERGIGSAFWFLPNERGPIFR